jgi:hypothetical protein
VADVEETHYVSRAAFLRARHVVVRPEAEAVEEAGQHQLARRDLSLRNFMREIVELIEFDDAEVAAQFAQIPVIVAEQPKAKAAALNWVDLAGDRFYEGLLARDVRPEDRDVFTASDLKREVTQHKAVAAKDVRVLEVDEQGSGVGHDLACIETDEWPVLQDRPSVKSGASACGGMLEASKGARAENALALA